MRIRLFDIAKALLIMLVYLWHIPRIYSGWLGGGNQALAALNNVNQCLFAPFFMAAFFAISGYFLNSERAVLKSVIHDFLTLVFPALTLSLLNNVLYTLLYVYYSGDWLSRFQLYTKPEYWQDSLGFWFLTSLFFNKQVLRLLVCYVRKTEIQLTLSMLLCVCGLVLMNGQIDIPNWFHFKEALLMCPMSLLGYLCKKNEIELSHHTLQYFALGYIISIIVLSICKNLIDGFNHGSSFAVCYIPTALWLGVSGTALVLLLSYWLQKSAVLGYIGRLSLPMFCLNFFFIDIYLRIFMPLVDRGYAFIYVIAVFLSSFLSGIILSSLLQTKYLRWILGRF